MGMTERHRKPGGFRKLVNSLETTDPIKRQKILETLRAEDAELVTDAEACIFNFEEFINVHDLVIGEIIFMLKDEIKTLAVALYKCPDPKLLEKFTKNMGTKEQFAFKEETGILKEITVGTQTSARYRIIQKAREGQFQGKYMLKKYNPKYAADPMP